VQLCKDFIQDRIFLTTTLLARWYVISSLVTALRRQLKAISVKIAEIPFVEM
jgi:hypothetical protein